MLSIEYSSADRASERRSYLKCLRMRSVALYFARYTTVRGKATGLSCLLNTLRSVNHGNNVNVKVVAVNLPVFI